VRTFPIRAGERLWLLIELREEGRRFLLRQGACARLTEILEDMTVRSSSKFPWRFVALLAVLAMIAAACGGTTSDTTAAPGDDVTDTTTGTGTTDTTTTEDTTPPTAEGFEYTIAVIEDFTTDNYWTYLDTDNSVYNGYLLGGQAAAVYTQVAPSFTLAPALAVDAVPPVGAADGDNWVISVPLREGPTWSDGEAIDANDVAFTFNTVKDLGLGGNWLGSIPLATDDDPETADVDESAIGLLSVEAADDYTVVYTFNGAPGLPLWQYGAAQFSVMPEHFWGPIVASSADAETFEASSGAGAPSAGGFTFTSREEGAFARLSAAPYYDTGAETVVYENGAVEYTSPAGVTETYGGTPEGEVISEDVVGPYASEVVFTVTGGQDQAVLALTEGEVDFWLTPLGVQRGFLDRILAESDLEVITNPNSGFRYLSFNTRKFPMSDTGFRQAMACMIDKEFMANNVLQGVAISLDTTVPPANAFWHNASIEAICAGLTQEERVAQAITILKDAGWTWDVEPVWNADELDVIPKGEGLTLNGEAIGDLTVLAPGPGYDPLRATYSLFIEDWAQDLGVPLSAEPTGFNVIVEKTFGPIDWDMFILGWGTGVFPDYVVDFFESSQDSAEGGFNTPGFKNAEFDALAAEFKQATELDVAQGLVFQMEEIIAEEVPYVVLFTTPVLEAYRNNLSFPFTAGLGGIQQWNGSQASVRSSQ
jgi:ABC-type transport system substrate-binding protein